ncbi:MAG: hypothetical protein HPY50_00080 [Firmicutes bacterium]|nr:hypothetical protein [Bacillota bacterium]
MSQSNYLTVSEVVDQLKSNYQKVLYLIRTNRIPAEKEGRAFRIPANYRELMEQKGDTVRKRSSHKGKRVSMKDKRGRAEVQKPAVNQDQLMLNLAQAIQDLVEYQVREAIKKLPPR